MENKNCKYCGILLETKSEQEQGYCDTSYDCLLKRELVDNCKICENLVDLKNSCFDLTGENIYCLKCVEKCWMCEKHKCTKTTECCKVIICKSCFDDMYKEYTYCDKNGNKKTQTFFCSFCGLEKAKKSFNQLKLLGQ